MNRTFKPKWQKIQILITWKLPSRSWQNFYKEYAPRMRLRGLSHSSPNKSKTATAAIFNFGKMSLTLDWIKISAPNFMGRCIAAMQRWPRDQKSKPEVNSCNVIRLKHKFVDLSYYNRYLNQIWYRSQISHCLHAGMVKFTTSKYKMPAAAILDSVASPAMGHWGTCPPWSLCKL